MSAEGDSIRESLRIRFLEHLPSRGFFMGNGMYLVYHPKHEEILIHSDQGGTAMRLDCVDIALLRRLLETVGEFRVPTGNARYEHELTMMKD
jgi:hypothetical protein